MEISDISKPVKYSIYGKKCYDIDELIDYDLDKYNFIKPKFDETEKILNNLTTELEKDEFVSEDKKLSFINIYTKYFMLAVNILNLKKEFQYLVKQKNDGVEYILDEIG